VQCLLALKRCGSTGLLPMVCKQVKTQHAIPSFNRPWEGKNDGFSTASAFVVGIDGGKRKLLCTTAGAVEHARKVRRDSYTA